MAILEENYQVRTDEHGLAVIEVTGRCTHDEKPDIEGNCTRRYQMVALPNASGAVLKSMDGTQPLIVEVSPPVMPGAVFRCVKVDGRVNPFAYKQTGGPFEGSFIHRYMKTFQQVGAVS